MDFQIAGHVLPTITRPKMVMQGLPQKELGQISLEEAKANGESNCAGNFKNTFGALVSILESQKDR